MQDLIGYDEIIENSMRSVIYETLKKIEKTGLLGNHYFVITFLTKFPGVKISKKLLEQYNDEMTIAIQYQYKSLTVHPDHFTISLSFSGKYEKLHVPYKSIVSFADPSMSFALKFSVGYDSIESIDTLDDIIMSGIDAQEKQEVDLSAKVISLDAFRKNKDDNDK